MAVNILNKHKFITAITLHEIVCYGVYLVKSFCMFRLVLVYHVLYGNVMVSCYILHLLKLCTSIQQILEINYENIL